MSEKFQKRCYDNYKGFRVHYTYGNDASESTSGYLHYDVDLSFIYFKKGTGKIIIEGHHYVINEGEIVLLSPSEMYLCTVDEAVEHERITIYFNELLLKNFNFDFGNILYPFYKRKKGEGNIITSRNVKQLGIDVLFDEVLSFAESNKNIERMLTACRIIELISAIDDTVLHSCRECLGKNPLIDKILRYINNHFKEDISITDISEHFYMDKYNFCHFFKQQVGVSAWNYIIFRRLNFCNEMIKQNVSIDEASYKSGFRNYSNFFRLYKKHMQMTPTEFKKQMMNNY